MALLAGPLATAEAPHPSLAPGETIEAEASADLDGDGRADLAYVAAKDGGRELRVVTTRRGDGRPQVLALDPYPLADADLKVTGTVLLLGELTGGTTAVASTHRFRWDAKLKAMRLIGLDATLYSRTYAHDGLEASWNLLTGAYDTRTLKLEKGAGDAGYKRVGERRRKKPSAPVRLENSPSGDDLLGWPGAQ